MSLKASDFGYPLDAELIAQAPLPRRDQSRLLILGRRDGRMAHHVFRELPELLGQGDLLVVNDTRVIPAKFTCRRSSGAKMDGLFLRQVDAGHWEAMLTGAGRCRIGESLSLSGAEGVELKLASNQSGGRWLLEVSPPQVALDVLQQAGSTPLPPYIHRMDSSCQSVDRERYQTVYATHPGAVAAPTAGLHFTEAVFQGLAARGIQTARVTLHVSLGTFAPVRNEDLAGHRMHSEWFDLPAETAEQINAARAAGRRIVAVGTTSVRVLEAAARLAGDGEIRPAAGWTDLFLYPPADFTIVDAMVTNFHLPRSTLLMLVAAFCSPGQTSGLEMILAAYGEAHRLRYRFYSYGDAMLIE